MQLVTGNRLRDGVPIFYAGAGSWSAVIDDAVLVPDDKAEALLAESQQGAPPLPAVGAMLIEASREGGRIRPIALRERIRAEGPTTGPMAGRLAVDTVSPERG